jgi:hypothetical protein
MLFFADDFLLTILADDRFVVDLREDFLNADFAISCGPGQGLR